MELREQFPAIGQYLFRHRGTLPATSLLVFLLALTGYAEPARFDANEAPWDVGLVLLCLLGLAIRVASVGFAASGTSGRNTRQQVADALNTTGMYSVVRHPLYLGNFFIFVGISLFAQNPWVTAVCGLSFWLFYVPVMMAEERFLHRKFGAAFVAWTQRTPAVLPHPWRWHRAAQRFSVRKAIRREYQTVYAIAVYFALLEMMEGYLFEKALLPEREVWMLLAVSTVLYVMVLLVAKRTRWLHDAPTHPPQPASLSADPHR